MIGLASELNKGDRYRLEVTEEWRLIKEITKSKDGFMRLKLSDGRRVAVDQTTSVQMRGENK